MTTFTIQATDNKEFESVVMDLSRLTVRFRSWLNWRKDPGQAWNYYQKMIETCKLVSERFPQETEEFLSRVERSWRAGNGNEAHEAFDNFQDVLLNRTRYHKGLRDPSRNIEPIEEFLQNIFVVEVGFKEPIYALFTEKEDGNWGLRMEGYEVTYLGLTSLTFENARAVIVKQLAMGIRNYCRSHLDELPDDIRKAHEGGKLKDRDVLSLYADIIADEFKSLLADKYPKATAITDDKKANVYGYRRVKFFHLREVGGNPPATPKARSWSGESSRSLSPGWSDSSPILCFCDPDKEELWSSEVWWCPRSEKFIGKFSTPVLEEITEDGEQM